MSDSRILLESGDYLLLESGGDIALLELTNIDVTDPAAVTTTVVAPTLSISSPSTQTPDAVTSTVTVIAPSVTVGAITLTFVDGQSTVQANQELLPPSLVVSGDVWKIVPNTIETRSTVIAPNIVKTLSLTPDAVASTTTVVGPSIINTLTLSVPTILSTATAHSPTITLTPLTLTPAAITSTVTVIGPDLLPGTILTVPTVVATTSVTPPSLSSAGNITQTMPVVTSTVTVIPPSISGPGTLTPDVITVPATVIAPTASYGAITLTVPAVSTTGTVIKPTITSAGNITVTMPEITVTVTVVSINNNTTIPVNAGNGGVVTATTTVIPPTITRGDTTFAVDELGRRQIVVDQQQGGEKYPFIDPSEDLDLLIGDLYLNYVDAACEFVPPFSIKWLSGFGTEDAEGTPPYTPNEYDLLIVDSNDDVVFDSTEATAFQVVDWGGLGYMKIAEWANEETGEILRVNIFTAWSPDDEPRDWPVYFEPADSRLDPRISERIPPHVSQLRIATDLYDSASDTILDQGTNVIFSGGYNSEFSELEDDAADINGDGLPLTSIIQLDMIPGAGLGRFPCEPETVIKRINGVAPDENGNILLDATDCYRLERPIEPSGENDATVVESTLQISNDCGPCCDCQDFINVYEAIRQLTDRYRTIGQRAEAARDQYRSNKDRWETGAVCRRESNVQVLAETFSECKVAFAVGICNNTDTAMTNVSIKISFEYGPDSNGVEAHSALPGCITCNSTTRRGNVVPGTGGGSGVKVYALEGTWPEFTATFDCINPGMTGSVSWVMWFEDCTDSDEIEFVVLGGSKVVKVSKTLMATAEGDCCEPELSSES